MYLKHLSLVQFKNYAELSVELDAGINCFVGLNGSGKTNILDAVHYTSMCRSYLNPIDSQNITFDHQFFIIQSTWQKNEAEIEIYCAVKKGQKKVFKKNKVEYDRLADHIGLLPTVMVSPYDADLIAAGSEVRRKWLDGIISQFDRSYLDNLIKYNAILEQRNALLKNAQKNGFFDAESIEVWDEQLVNCGNLIHNKRKDFVTQFKPTFDLYFSALSPDSEQVEFEYKSQLFEGPFNELLNDSRRKDQVLGYTNVGIHRDDLIFKLHDHPIKKVGSQGQQKSFLIALKLAQFVQLYEALKVKPVLLLDDIFDKLDNKRVGHLMELVSRNKFGQVLVTDTDRSRVEGVFKEIAVPYKMFSVEKDGVKCHE